MRDAKRNPHAQQGTCPRFPLTRLSYPVGPEPQSQHLIYAASRALSPESRTPLSISSWVIVSGGASEMTFPIVTLKRNPLESAS